MVYYPSNARYEKKNLVKVVTAFNRKTEPELVKRIEQEENKAGDIKRLVREDIEREAQRSETK